MSRNMETENPMKPRRFEIRHDPNVSVRLKKTRKLTISKELCLSSYWNVMGPLVAAEIAGTDYSPIPHCLDTNAYNIGYIFVQTSCQMKCCRGLPVLKVLGPIAEFVVRDETDREWISREFPSIKTSGDHVDFKVIVEAGEDVMYFAGYNYYFLTKAEDMVVEKNVTIDRASHESLRRARWVGLITGVMMTSSFEIRITKHLSERIFRVADNPHAILFKYNICKLNSRGTVVKVSSKNIRCKWLPLDNNQKPDRLPLPKLLVHRDINS